jgi:hydantoinase/carbamoylase family amidase
MNQEDRRVLANRVERHLRRISEFGFLGPKDGWSRLALSLEENLAHEYAAELLRSLGFDVRVDRSIGNLFARKGGRSDTPAVMLASHLDTVPKGGGFDGVVGFIVAVESVRMAESRGSLPVPVEVAVFRAQESSRFSKACLGSRAAFGFLTPQDVRRLHATEDHEKRIPLAAAIEQCGFDASLIGEDNLRAAEYCAYYETQIEQSTVLERLGCIGNVTSIRAPQRRQVSVSGARAIKASCAMILAVEWTCRLNDYLGADIVGTVGKVDGFFQGAESVNVIPGDVAFHLPDIDKYIHRILQPIEVARGVKLVFDDAAYGALPHVVGVSDHSGATPMGSAFRRDALVAAAEMVLAVEDGSLPPEQKIDFFIDLRSTSASTRSRVGAEIVNVLAKIADGFGVQVSLHEPIEETEPVERLNEGLRQRVRQAAADLGVEILDLPRGAGHDAMFAALAGIPTGMMLLQSQNGISHNPNEFTPTEDIVKAIELQAAVLASWN